MAASLAARSTAAHVDVEWTHADGFPDDTLEVPVSLQTAQMVLDRLLDAAVTENVIGEILRVRLAELACSIIDTSRSDLVEHGLGLLTVKSGNRSAIKDQVSVVSSVTDSTIAIMLDGKRKALAAALGVLP